MKLEKNLCAFEILIIACVLLGALAIQYFKHEEPCALCFLQRLSMFGVGGALFLNIRWTPRKEYYGFALLFAILGGFVALRQIALHACPSFPTFGVPFLGLNLYTWSFLVFVCTVGYNALLLILFDRKTTLYAPMSFLGRLSCGLLTLAAFLNIFAALHVCGFGLC